MRSLSEALPAVEAETTVSAQVPSTVGRNQKPDRSTRGESKGSHARLGVKAPMGCGRLPLRSARELGAAGIFVRDEVLVLGQEEEGVHLPLHRLVGDVVARLVRRSEPPIDDLSARGERPPQRVVGIDLGAQVHRSSATFTGATSL